MDVYRKGRDDKLALRIWSCKELKLKKSEHSTHISKLPGNEYVFNRQQKLSKVQFLAK